MILPTRLAVAALTVAALLPTSAGAANVEIGRGRIAAGHPAADVRTVTVITDGADRFLPQPVFAGIDGFFLAAPEPGTLVSTVTTDHGGLGYSMNINFHRGSYPYGLFGPRTWIGGCSVSNGPKPGSQLEVVGCEVPLYANTVEVSADWGRDLEVVVIAAD